MSREKILAAIRRNKPAPAPLPDLPLFPGAPERAVETFQQMVEAGGGRSALLTREASLQEWIGQHFPEATQIASTLPSFSGLVDLHSVSNPVDLETVDLAVIPGELGVAENGAVWVTEAGCTHRVLPFITQHLILVLNPARIVRNMHEAYRQIKTDETGFGVFIAGPSKTADIEQSLVIGAQAARSFTVILNEDQPL
jgi:L-lactate dehydrogenase complex protein LldG